MNRKIYILGYGNLGSHLLNLFISRGIKVEGIFTDQQGLNIEVPIFNKTSFTDVLKPSDVLFIATKDDEIIKFVNQSQNLDVIRIFCSGGIQFSYFENTHHLGVWYPLYSFSKNQNINWNEVPVFIEFQDNETGDFLKQLNEILLLNYRILNSEQRANLHLSAVFANNFVNACMIACQEILENNEEAKFQDLFPIINQTIEKLKNAPALDCQTGPARRNDEITMGKHIDYLKSNPYEQQLYLNISNYIQQKLKNNL